MELTKEFTIVMIMIGLLVCTPALMALGVIVFPIMVWYKVADYCRNI